MNRLLFFLLSATVLFIFGCEKTESENVRTSGLSARISAVATGDGNTTVKVFIDVGESALGTDVELTGGDSLSVTANGETHTMAKRSSGVRVWYETLFDFDDPDTEFNIVLTRPNEGDAPNSFATLPEAFVFQLPSANESFFTDEDVSVTWSPSGISSKVNLRVATICQSIINGALVNESTSYDIDDTGSFTFAVNNVMPKFNVDTSKNCSATLTLSRTVEGELDPNFGEGGWIFARQSRDLDIIFEHR